MEQITKRDGIYYYGQRPCEDVDDAYYAFRADYHESIGRKAFSRLDRLGQRRERVHGFGFIFFGETSVEQRPCLRERRRCYLLGLLHISYCWIIDLSDLHDLGEDELDRWVDDAFMKGSKILQFIGRREKSGRTSKRLKRRFK